MSDTNPEPDAVDDMLPEYDFTGGVRGKHYQAYRNGHTVIVHQTDGSTIVQHVTVEEGAVMLDPDVRAYFPDAASVNHALRTLIKLFPAEQVTTTTE